MKKSLCTLVSLLLCLSMCTGSLGEAATTALDYTVAEKLFKQMEAGSGFTGMLTVSLSAQEGYENEAITSANPLTFDISSIFVREDAINGVPAEQRYGLVFKDGEHSRASLAIATRNGLIHLKSDLAGDGWFTLPKESMDVTLPTNASVQATAATAAPNRLTAPFREVIAQSPLPALLDFALPALLQWQNLGGEALTEALSSYTTKIDLWIEAYRQNTVLGKLEDGTATMEAQYEIPPAAIKAQIKQMLMDLLSDPTLLSQLQTLLPEAYTPLLLNPQMQSYYFFAIDELPLAGNLTLSRTVSLRGDTLALHIALPLYDQAAGAVTITYDRKAGTGQDLPDENIISLESRDWAVQLEYQKYQTMTGVSVYQGSLLRQPRTHYEVNEDDSAAPAKTFSAAFTLTHEQTGGMDEERYETETHNYKLTLEPFLYKPNASGVDVPLSEEEKDGYYLFPAFDLAVNAMFKSKQEKNAPTAIDLTASFSGEDIPQVVDIALSGKTRSKWTPEAIDLRTATDLGAMSNEEMGALLAQIGIRAGLCFAPFLSLPPPAETTGPGTDDGPLQTLAPGTDGVPTETPAPTGIPLPGA